MRGPRRYPPLHSLVSSRLLLLAVGVAGGCRDAPAPVTVGFAFPEWGYRNVVTARDELDSLGMGDAVRIVYDSLVTGDPADAEVTRASTLLSTPGLVAVVGHGGSRGSLAAAPVYNAAGVPHIEPTGTSVRLLEAGSWTFRLAPTDVEEGAFIGAYLAGRPDVRNVTVFYVNDEYGRGLLEGVRAALGDGPVRVVDEVPYTTDGPLEDLARTSYRTARPDAVVLAARADEGGRIMASFHALDPELVFVGGDGMELGPRLASAAQASLDQLVVVSFWDPASENPESLAFARRYRRLVGDNPQSPHAMRHDALMVVAAAIRDGARTREAIREYLESLGLTRPPYPGVTGPIRFDAGRSPPMYLVRGDGTPLAPTSQAPTPDGGRR